MQNVLVSFLILWYASSYFVIGYGRRNFNVLDYGANGDGRSDDSKVRICVLCFCATSFFVFSEFDLNK